MQKLSMRIDAGNMGKRLLNKNKDELLSHEIRRLTTVCNKL